MFKFDRRRRLWLLWIFATALVLQTALPLLASTSAKIQGKTVFEVCSVYGVKVLAVEFGEDRDHSTRPGFADQCPLAVLATLTQPQFVSQKIAEPGETTTHSRDDRHLAHPHDNSQAWVVARKQGPPPRS